MLLTRCLAAKAGWLLEAVLSLEGGRCPLGGMIMKLNPNSLNGDGGELVCQTNGMGQTDRLNGRRPGSSRSARLDLKIMWEPLPSRPAERITCTSTHGSVVPDPVVYDFLEDSGAAEGVHFKRVNGLTAQTGRTVAWVQELKIEFCL